MATKKQPVEIINNVEECNVYCEQYYNAGKEENKAKALKNEARDALLITTGEFAETYTTKTWQFTVVGAYDRTAWKVDAETLKTKYPVIFEQLVQAEILTEETSHCSAKITNVKPL